MAYCIFCVECLNVSDRVRNPGNGLYCLQPLLSSGARSHPCHFPSTSILHLVQFIRSIMPVVSRRKTSHVISKSSMDPLQSHTSLQRLQLLPPSLKLRPIVWTVFPLFWFLVYSGFHIGDHMQQHLLALYYFSGELALHLRYLASPVNLQMVPHYRPCRSYRFFFH